MTYGHELAAAMNWLRHELKLCFMNCNHGLHYGIVLMDTLSEGNARGEKGGLIADDSSAGMGVFIF